MPAPSAPSALYVGPEQFEIPLRVEKDAPSDAPESILIPRS